MEMALADGEGPLERVAMAEAKELQKLAEPHNIQKPFSLVLDEQEELKLGDNTICPEDRTKKIEPLHVEARCPSKSRQ